MIGGYDQNMLDRSAETWPTTQAAARGHPAALQPCHSGAMTLPASVCDEIVAPPWEDMSPEDPRRRFSRHLLYDLTRPEKSPLLLAALAKEAGGLAPCRADKQNADPVAAIFKDTADPDYVTIHAAITDAKKKLDESNASTCPVSVRDPNGCGR